MAQKQKDMDTEMKEAVIEYEDKKVLEALMDLGKHFGFEVVKVEEDFDKETGEAETDRQAEP